MPCKVPGYAALPLFTDTHSVRTTFEEYECVETVNATIFFPKEIPNPPYCMFNVYIMSI